MMEIPVEIIRSWESGAIHLKLIGRPLSKAEFSTLLKNDLIYKMESENDEEIPGGWYIVPNIEKIEKLIGRTFNNNILNHLERQREESRKLDKAYELAQNFVAKCPKCGERLEAAEWNSALRATLRCYRHKYTAVVDLAKNQVLDEGFDDEKNKEYGVELWWYKALLRTGEVKKAKAEIMKRRPIGVCTICGISLPTPQDVLQHLKEHGCD